jgi:phosphopantetheinyl transferase (holo-ACP synthase)
MSTFGDAPMRVGNDVVDLNEPRIAGKSGDQRFIDRVYAESERMLIEGAQEPDLELWTLWAAKEAAYKVVSKVQGSPPPFVHAAFEISWTEVLGSMGPVVRIGTVQYEGMTIPVSVYRAGGPLHAVAWVADPPLAAGSPADQLEWSLARLDEPDATWSRPLHELRSLLTEDELDAVHSRESAAVRVGARFDIARVLSIEPQRLQIVCVPGATGRRPPLLLLDGGATHLDVSLSHHGDWIGWAFTTDPAS